MKLTKEQKVALKRVYDRGTDWWRDRPESYLAYRRTVQQGYDCIMVPAAGIWLGIEKDGYTHS